MRNSQNQVDAAWIRGLQSIEPSIAEALTDHGCSVSQGRLPSREWFEGLYQRYDALSALAASNSALANAWEKLVQQWLSESDNRSYFCGVPASYRDKSERSGKRDKEYIQYIRQFFESPIYRTSDLREISEFLEFEEYIHELNEICAEIFGSGVGSILGTYPDLRNRLVGDSRGPAIVIKILRYNPNPQRFGTGPHFDKSALSILMHSSDSNVQYRLCRYMGESLKYSDLTAPIEYPALASEKNASVLIAGSCLRAVGALKFPPTPHSVLPIAGSKPRHAVVAFLLLPHLDTAPLSARAQCVNDLYPDLT